MTDAPLTLAVFTAEYLSIFDCNAIETRFYNDCLRYIRAAGISNAQKIVNKPSSEQFRINDSFHTQHGDVLPGILYLGISKPYCHMDRYYRVTREIREYTFVNSHLTELEIELELAGLPGEGQGIIDRIFSEIENERV